ncbi:natural resistance-associated macrophage protein-domain-containing protein [Xylaria bambusicola]|uniref:natural resistance-associated macrophage protein-domain-containing protein n=1 Tax=Xylaria bambusicola TaxID=326684 RepID=UPI0020076006|nr:natural resistance-associated macrophage protein-domain-containing protein [Xylaria bambusicola]KAI0515029.1 natural resistance-associated macrophage protein-domain-containing protein [Xylaria bambusicola]
MNKTSRTDEPYDGEGLNQNPNIFSNDLVTNEDFNGIANARERRARNSRSMANSGQPIARDVSVASDDDDRSSISKGLALGDGQPPEKSMNLAQAHDGPAASSNASVSASPKKRSGPTSLLRKTFMYIVTLGKFVGPGFLVAVAYIDPGNYSTGISAGAAFRFQLLFIILLSNLFAILLQCLAVKLGTVTGMNLAECCRAFLPRWMNYFLYFLAEAAILATDIAEVIGTAIALNLLIPAIPLVAGCALSILDVFIILFFYRPTGSMNGLRIFEIFVMLLVLTVAACFSIQLSLIKDTRVGEVFRGYLPSDVITKSEGLYQACGILGATVMPHSLYLGSGVVQSRLRDYDLRKGLLPENSAGYTVEDLKTGDKTYYVPSLAAIKYSLKYTYTEVGVTLFTFALFVNSAILIVSGASLFGNPDVSDADIFSIHDLLAKSISPFAGVIFALALLFSGVSAGIVCTISGQMVSEGALRWKVKPWLRRLITRSIAITPSIIVAGATGRSKLNDALNGTQVVLSIVLPFVSAPLIWFTCFNKYMVVRSGQSRVRVEGKDTSPASTSAAGVLEKTDQEVGEETERIVKMGNPWYICVAAVVVWLLIVILNVANLVLLGQG